MLKGLYFIDTLLQVSHISAEQYIDNAGLSVLEHDVLHFLHVPAHLSEHGEYMTQNSHLVVVSHTHLVELALAFSSVHAILIVNHTLIGKLLDNALGFLANSCFSLLGAGADMVSSIYSGVFGNRVIEVSLFTGGFSKIHICTVPEASISLKMSK